MQYMQKPSRIIVHLQGLFAKECTVCKTTLWLRTRRSGVRILFGVPKTQKSCGFSKKAAWFANNIHFIDNVGRGTMAGLETIQSMGEMM